MAPTCRINSSRASAYSTIVGGPAPRDVSHGPYRLPRLIENSGISDLRASSRSRTFQTARARLETELQYPSMLFQNLRNMLHVFLPDCHIRNRH